MSGAYKPSIVYFEDRCALGGKKYGPCDGELEVHHCFGGPNRKLATQDGLTVRLCHKHHFAVHNTSRAADLELKQAAQMAYMEEHECGIRAFRNRYGKNYLELTEDE